MSDDNETMPDEIWASRHDDETWWSDGDRPVLVGTRYTRADLQSEQDRVMALMADALEEAMTLDDVAYDCKAIARGEHAITAYNKLKETK